MNSRRRMEEELERDIADHIALETDENIARGMSPEEARYAALRKFGNITRVKEDTRSVWGWTSLEMLYADVKHAFRKIGRAPGTACLVVLSLALAFAPSVTMFSVMDRLFLTPLPIRAPSEVFGIMFRDTSPNAKYLHAAVSYPDYRDLRGSLQSLSGLVYQRKEGVIVLLNGRRTTLLSNLVSSDYFKVLGLPVQSGPGLSEGRNGVVISHSLWMREFNGAPDVIGRTLLVDGQGYTIDGVAAPGFQGMSKLIPNDLWIPLEAWLRLQPKFRGVLEQRDRRDGGVWARLRPGVLPAQAAAEVKAVTNDLAQRWPETNRYLTGEVFDELSDRGRSGVLVTGIGVLLLGILLAVACANVAGILLARAEERRHETSVRLALGASRLRLMREWMVESIVLASLGAALGLAGARVLMILLPGLLPSVGIPLSFEFSIGPRVWAYAASLVCVSALAFGLVPAWRASRPDLVSGLRRDSAISLLRVRIPVRSLLIVAQVAAAEILLFGAGLVLNSLATAQRVDPVFDPDRPVVLAWVAPTAEDGGPGEVDFGEMAARLSRIGGVRRVAYGRSLPSLGDGMPGFQLEAPGLAPREITGGSAGPGFLSALGVRMRSGRDLGRLDQNAAVVSASLARLLDPAGNVLGRPIRLDGAVRQIVGVFPDTDWTLETSPSKQRAIVLTPAHAGGGIQFAVEVPGDPNAYVAAVRNELAALHVTPLVLKTLRQHYDETFFVQRMATKALYGLGLLALLLTATGLHGITNALLARRAKEFSIRLTLGATPGRIVALVFRGGLKLTAIGLIVGLCIAVPAAVVVASDLHGFSPWSPAALGLSSAIVIVTGILAAAQPARRVLRLHPAEIIRAE